MDVVASQSFWPFVRLFNVDYMKSKEIIRYHLERSQLFLKKDLEFLPMMEMVTFECIIATLRDLKYQGKHVSLGHLINDHPDTPMSPE